MKLERSKPEDAAEMAHWMALNLPMNDASIRDLKHCAWFKVQDVLYLPVRPIMMLESLAPNPKVTGKKRALALRRAMDGLRKLYPNVEFMFLSRTGTKLGKAAKVYGFEESVNVVYRLTDYAEGRKRAKESKRRLAEVRLRNHAGAGGRTEAAPAGHVPYL